MTRPPLRHGYTTGACATAASLAAALALVRGERREAVTIRLPRGKSVRFALDHLRPCPGGFQAGVVKDAGDDPDVTHGAVVFARVSPSENPGIHFRAAEGVGTVTRPGLPVPVGEPAINPVPRQMMRDHLSPLLGGTVTGLTVAVGVEKGEALAARTLNPRLGIVGGLSILGTTGIVRPFSCSAWVHAIHRAVDVARANGCEHLVACTGSTSERALRALHRHLPELAFVEMGDVVGALLKYLRGNPVPHLTLGAGFAKLCKLAQGRMDLHSRRGGVDLAALARWAQEAGLPDAGEIAAAPTALAALERWGEPLARVVAGRAAAVVRARLPDLAALEVVAVDRSGRIRARVSG